jgi:hypothetical protein
MKIITFLLTILLSVSLAVAQKNSTESRKNNTIELQFNSQWTFNYFPSETADKGYELSGFNDSRWPAVSLPHTWNSFETTGELRPFTKSPGEIGETYWWTGWGWYRKHFAISSEYAESKVFIEFEGVQKYCKVWVNSKYVGDHKGGYGSFDFDITGFLKPGGDNVIAVAVSFLQKDEFRIHPLAEGNFNVSCGIYRNVTLVVKNRLYIPMQGSALHEGGTLIATPGISEKESIVNVKTWVKNDYAETRSCLLQTSIIDMNNQVVQVIKTEAEINAGQLYRFNQFSKPIKNPHLWSVEDPYLYTVNSEVIDKKEVVDSCSSPLGLRWFRIDEKDTSVYLNDRKIELTGVNRHQEYPWLGDAIPAWMTETDYSEISGNRRYNFVRTINYPADKVAYGQADKKGIIAEEDFSAIMLHGFSVEEQKQQIREMIRRDRNHPGIMSWRFGDEVLTPDLMKFVLIEDSTRMIKSFRVKIDSVSEWMRLAEAVPGSGAGLEPAGEPARIILKCSHNKLAADRGSVAVVSADITDQKGKHVPGTKNTLRWVVEGPARLAGPAYYASYDDSSRNSEKGWYRETPASNIIRSTGKPGRIKVVVFSSGLASGSLELDAEEIKYDNSVVNIPILGDEGRKPVTSNSLVTERLEEIPQEISPASGDFNLTSSDKTGYAGILMDYIKQNNPLADTLSVELNTLIELLAIQLLNNNGYLSAADYNFNVMHHNTCRLISGYIAKTKLPPLFKESMRQYYSELLIMKGNEKNAGDEMNWLNWIPSGGVVVIVTNEKTSISQKGVIYTKHEELSEIIKVVYPQFAKFSEDAKERALVFISKMNPSVHAQYLRKNVNPGDKTQNNAKSYTAEKGQPILIPEYKFISE